MREVYTYDTSEYDFRGVVENYIECRNLECLHEKHKFEGRLTAGVGDYGDQKQGLHRKFYCTMDEDPTFVTLYRDFIANVVRPIFDEDIYYQKYPTFRIHQPENICVFKWHKDKEFGHSEKEINFFLPITKAFETNTIWAETEEGKEDYEPIEAEYGELVKWYGAKLKHGNKDNETGKTRVSFDFRVIKESDYDEDDTGESLTRGTKFVLGEYFEKIKN